MIQRQALMKFRQLGEQMAHLQVGVNRLASTTSNIFCKRLEGKVAVVTGSTEGIGFAISRRLAYEGAFVVISSRKQSNVDKAVQALQTEGLTNVSGVVCHVGKKEDREALIKHATDRAGGIDIFVANAGMNPYSGRTLDTPESVWDKVFDINLKSTFLFTQQIVPHIENRG
ncbi:Dehydrogenase reductase SDR member 4, partial [Chamberlinius hualienensis]